jgi:hypothetical protein
MSDKTQKGKKDGRNVEGTRREKHTWKVERRGSAGDQLNA